ncbi:Flp family type IVb pilin [Lederbergia wuyishanensis]|uniref:Pilus assembly protein Flp/PilA n=1 Tax=Lederbergia wuyishanensis TaxID=1347903 RepID=A0ABU0D8A1_9BACI|nr:Flp family type IVb pilin [Lederbergia wuyishanensis]MCJ8009238.1 Flp family type IVb pilin [Lederbergia wuyishanensis]MDQ0344629.1 pilus assembly protein Flp/PilA [Lederbergia wuyishanensis]
MMNQVMRLFKEEEGQALTEYGLLVGLIAVFCIGSIALIGPKLKEYFDAILTALGVAAPE